ncbi:tetratricopeptide repeat protein [Saccharothrix obliqua]|uniref:tetratricopeptide repeat protein n=1 Tax=Saccharothrix obliqua TaxID=2861747 RepID=UPI001C5EC0C6|nr:tetratricopeptide repeat protein [Saccharothrix obliqua]MBW4717710.1 tetratricopeptide repeat protein [Saccharothrix obliqua]
MDVGAPHGIRFRFEAGLLRAVLLDVHGKPPLVLAEHGTAGHSTRDLTEERSGSAIRAELRLRFELPSPAWWRLDVGASGVATADGVAFTLPDEVVLHVASAAPVAAVPGGAEVRFPAGPGELTLAVVSTPLFGVGDTVVVCRPDQVRAAAVVVSCLPADRFTPVVPIVPPVSGVDGGHHPRLAGLLAATGVRRAAFLCEPDPASAELFDGMTRVRLTDDPGSTTAAWRALRAGEPEPLDVPPAVDPTAALFTALRLGRPLRFTPDAPDLPFAEHNPNGGEAVLVEDHGTVDALVAACYAHHRDARLVITPPPDLADVRRVVAQEQERVAAAARAIGDAVKGIGFVEALWRYLSTGDHDPYAEVEAVVTAQVPATAVAEVGDRRLTAFTTGLPYPFVRTESGNWARKPIGHVVADPTPVVLTELHAAGAARSPGAFSLVFDTDPHRVVDGPTGHIGHFTHPVVLSGADASVDALRELAAALPVELVFFNTHDGDGIVLGDEELSEPPHLPHRPIVFNNSCRSWTDLAREFGRAGARGYVGALWPIPPNLAAGFARTVLRRLTTEELPAAHAVVGTGTPGGVERAYLYAGTVNGRLDEWRDRSTTDGAAALTAAALLAGADVGEARRPVLRRAMAAARAAAERAGATDHPAYADALLDGLAVADDDVEAAALLARLDDVLPALDLPAAEVGARWARRHRLTGARHEERGEYDEALADFERCVGWGEACRDRADVLLRMARLLAHRGRPEEARQAALEARDAFRASGGRARLMEAIGVLGELSGDDHEAAARYAAEGHDLAVELADRPRQAAFKLAECVRLRRAGDPAGAVEAGARAAELFRVAGDVRSELAAVRELVGCHRDLGDLAAARDRAIAGVALAERLAPADLATCLDELGRVLTARGEHAQALEHYRHAVELLVAKGEWRQGAALLPNLAVGAVRAGDPGALWTTALCGGLICELASHDTWSSVVPLVVDSMKRAIETGPRELTERGMTDFAHAVTTGDRDGMPFQVGVLADVVVVLLAWLMDRVDHEIVAFARELDRTTAGVLALEHYISVPSANRVRAAVG